MTLQITGLTPLIQVYDMPEAIRFYCEGLGFEIAANSGEIEAPEGRYFHWAWLRLGGADLMLNTAYDPGERPPERDPARQAAHRDTGLFFACPDVDAAAAELRARGIEVKGPETARLRHAPALAARSGRLRDLLPGAGLIESALAPSS